MTQDLQNLQQTLVVQLSQDVSRLQSEKSRLIDDIDSLQVKRQHLAAEHDTAISQQQIAQQQIWASQMAQAIADHLQTLMVNRLSQTHPLAGHSTPATLPPGTVEPEATHRILASLDASVNQTLDSVKRDLSSYQSTLSQQLNRMQTMQQQGEAILEVLVSRLNQQLREEIRRPQSAGLSPSQNGYSDHRPDPPDPWESSSKPSLPYGASSNGAGRPPSPTTPYPSPQPVTNPAQPPKQAPKELSHFQLGLIMVLGSTLALSLHNVVVGIIGNESSIFNIWSAGGYISLSSLGNSMLVLLIRMLIVVPLMAIVATILYPTAWNDIKKFCQSKDYGLMQSVIGSGFFLFLSQVLIYIAIAGIGPGVAVTILFMYPIITAPLAWILFGDRPSLLRVVVMVGIFIGVILTGWPGLQSTNSVSVWGIVTAVISGIAFACYLISMQISFRKLHPVPVSVIQFFTIFVLTCISLIVLPAITPITGFDYGLALNPQGKIGLLIGGLVLGALTLMGYLLNNFGVRYMGAARASIIASSGPVLTAVLAVLVTPGDRNALAMIQIIGILIVTIGVTAMNFEKMFMQKKKKAPAR
jgi:drug/metabolite transporter (DMT)-like permease